MSFSKKLGIVFIILIVLSVFASLRDNGNNKSVTSSNSSSNNSSSTTKTKTPEELAQELEKFKSECQTIPCELPPRQATVAS